MEDVGRVGARLRGLLGHADDGGDEAGVLEELERHVPPVQNRGEPTLEGLVVADVAVPEALVAAEVPERRARRRGAVLGRQPAARPERRAGRVREAPLARPDRHGRGGAVDEPVVVPAAEGRAAAERARDRREERRARRGIAQRPGRVRWRCVVLERALLGDVALVLLVNRDDATPANVREQHVQARPRHPAVVERGPGARGGAVVRRVRARVGLGGLARRVHAPVLVRLVRLVAVLEVVVVQVAGPLGAQRVRRAVRHALDLSLARRVRRQVQESQVRRRKAPDRRRHVRAPRGRVRAFRAHVAPDRIKGLADAADDLGRRLHEDVHDRAAPLQRHHKLRAQPRVRNVERADQARQQ